MPRSRLDTKSAGYKRMYTRRAKGATPQLTMSKHIDHNIDEKQAVTSPSNDHMTKDETITTVLEINGYGSESRRGSRRFSRRFSEPDFRSDVERVDYISKVTEDGEKKFHRLTWKQLVVVLIVCAVALGTLSMPL